MTTREILCVLVTFFVCLLAQIQGWTVYRRKLKKLTKTLEEAERLLSSQWFNRVTYKHQAERALEERDALRDQLARVLGISE